MLILFHVTTPPPIKKKKKKSQTTDSFFGKETHFEEKVHIERSLEGILLPCPKAASEDKTVVISPNASPPLIDGAAAARSVLCSLSWNALGFRINTNI